MNIQRPYQGRAVINETINTIEIIIPAKKNILIILFMGFWLCAWTCGEFFAIRTLIYSPTSMPGFARLFMIAWLGAWTTGGFFAFKAFLWNLLGKETILLDKHTMTITRTSGLFTKQKIYDLTEVKKIRVHVNSNAFGNTWGNTPQNSWGFISNGIIHFDYGMKTVKFGFNGKKWLVKIAETQYK